ncbi:MAG: Holliday junction branch migration protein RuvA [Geobacteraceae bacterium]
MIALLTGRIAHKSPEFIILDVNGVGYQVQIPFSTYYELPDEGKTVSLSIYTHVREDAITLFGFRTSVEKQFFKLLISVSGIGPKMAKDILSNIQPNELAYAIVHGDLTRLATIPGIGKKTAERMVLELKDKALKIDIGAPSKGDDYTSVSSAITDDVASALVNLGYKEALVQKALGGMIIGAEDTVEGILKQALKKLMK